LSLFLVPFYLLPYKAVFVLFDQLPYVLSDFFLFCILTLSRIGAKVAKS